MLDFSPQSAPSPKVFPVLVSANFIDCWGQNPGSRTQTVSSHPTPHLLPSPVGLAFKMCLITKSPVAFPQHSSARGLFKGESDHFIPVRDTSMASHLTQENKGNRASALAKKAPGYLISSQWLPQRGNKNPKHKKKKKKKKNPKH